MSDQNGAEASPSTASRRRGSLASIMDMFAGRSSGGANSPPAGGGSSYPGPITQAAAQAQQRRLSVATAGLGNSPTQQSPFENMRSRTQSISGSSSGSLDESPFEDHDGPAISSNPNPSSPFARRVSFGAQAMRDMRSKSGSAASPPSGNANGRPSVINIAASDRPSKNTAAVAAASPPTAKNGRDGYNFAENMRARAERGSMSAGGPNSPPVSAHGRAKSVAVMEPPVREMPTQPRKPDHFQERILKGDFYMD